MGHAAPLDLDVSAPWSWWREQRLRRRGPAPGHRGRGPLVPCDAGRRGRARRARGHRRRLRGHGRGRAGAGRGPGRPRRPARRPSGRRGPRPSAEAALDVLLRIGRWVWGTPWSWPGANGVPTWTRSPPGGCASPRVPDRGDGAIDLAALEQLLATARPALVHLTQVTSHRGLVQPAAAAAEVCRGAACRSGWTRPRLWGMWTPPAAPTPSTRPAASG